jgi:hypothetical protein
MDKHVVVLASMSMGQRAQHVQRAKRVWRVRLRLALPLYATLMSTWMIMHALHVLPAKLELPATTLLLKIQLAILRYVVKINTYIIINVSLVTITI